MIRQKCPKSLNRHHRIHPPILPILTMNVLSVHLFPLKENANSKYRRFRSKVEITKQCSFTVHMLPGIGGVFSRIVDEDPDGGGIKKSSVKSGTSPNWKINIQYWALFLNIYI
jgi:hypothetical protein